MTVVKVSLPNDKWHGEKVIKAGPDGKLYIPVGAPCNVCETEDTMHAKIYRMNADGSQSGRICARRAQHGRF
jgi:glucose/arabinose dehydrogenase